mmetsp:Transcript_19800/g.66583  ORF Transcript_19800/g.66583 Transcript_19800/m.66583 type:complete len:305 (+) Transcript_19800:555-1469(+)
MMPWMPAQKAGRSAVSPLACSTMSWPAFSPSQLRKAWKMLSITRCVSARSSLTMPASRKVMRRWPFSPDTRMFPGCRSACTKLSMNIILAMEFMPSLESSFLQSASHASESMKCAMGVPSSKVSMSTRWDERESTGPGITIVSSSRKLCPRRRRLCASTRRSSWRNICLAKSSTNSGSESQWSAGTRPRRRARDRRMSMSTKTVPCTPGCSTFTATSRPSGPAPLSRPRYTCAMHPEPITRGSSARSSSQSAPSSRASTRRVAAHGCGKTLSWSCSKVAQKRSGKRSLRLLAHWASLMKAGPAR